MIKNCILLGRKPEASKALEYLLKQKINIRFVVAEENDKYKIKLSETAKKHNIPVIFNDSEIYELIKQKDPLVKDIDLVISYLYWRKIKSPLINLGSKGCINFHPAPLPDYKGRAGYNTAILDDKDWFGVSAHFIEKEEFDTGPIIKVLKFPIDENETAFSLEKKSQKEMIKLFRKTIALFQSDKKIKTTKNIGGIYLNGKQLEELKIVNLNDSAENIKKKIKAFFFPPYTGAKIIIDGEDFTLIDNELLKFIDQKIKR